jgi:N-acyl-L-homoserine lactone synthetase
MPYYFRKAQTNDDYQKIHALRFQTYCVEKKWLKSQCYPDRLEKDVYDPYSTHFLAERENGDIVGTVRLILSDRLPKGKTLPIAKHPNVDADSLIAYNSAEISRLIIDKSERRKNIELGFYRLIYHSSKEYGISHWYITVNKGFLLILQRLCLPFQQLAEPGEYMGTTTPAELSMSVFEQHLSRENQVFFDWLQAAPDVLEDCAVIPRSF